jgi:TRAP transporter 4TM/12TM fusion protein
MTSEPNGPSLFRRALDLLGSENVTSRTFEGPTKYIAFSAGVALSAFMLYCAVSIVPFYAMLSVYFGLTSILVFFFYPARSASTARLTIVDILLIGMTIASVVYFITFFEAMEDRAGIVTNWDFFFGVLAIIVSLESCRRVLGPILPGLGALLILYCYLGPYFPAEMSHKGFQMSRIVSFLYSMDGILGVVINAFASFIFLFILFGAFLTATRVGEFFIDLALSLVGRTRGGAAKVSIISSCLVGSVVGSGSANVAITGVFTIPLMKKTGYKPHMAAAIEAVASTGGHIMPPVMGAVVFLMAAFTRTSYIDIVKISIIPALIFYFTVYLTAHLWAVKHGIEGMKEEALPNFWKTLKKSWFLFLPIFVLIVLLGLRYSPHLCAVFSILAMFLVSLIRPDSRLTPMRLLQTLFDGAKSSLIIGASAGTMGIILGGILLPGLGYKFSSLILSYSYNYLPMAMVLVFLGAYVLGMGMTVSGVYVVLSVLAAPALIELGVPILAAHLTIIWFAQTSPLTPPFCLAAFVGAGIAKCNPMKAGWSSVRLGYPYYIMPFLFIYSALLLEGSWFDVIRAVVAGTIGMGVLTVAFERFWSAPLSLLSSVLLVVVSGVILFAGPWFQLLGVIFVTLFFFAHRRAAVRPASAMG